MEIHLDLSMSDQELVYFARFYDVCCSPAQNLGQFLMQKNLAELLVELAIRNRQFVNLDEQCVNKLDEIKDDLDVFTALESQLILQRKGSASAGLFVDSVSIHPLVFKELNLDCVSESPDELPLSPCRLFNAKESCHE